MHNLAKSIFIGLVLTLTTLSSIYALQQFWQEFSFLWLATFVAAIPLSAVIGYFFTFGRARTAPNLWPMLIISTLACLMVIYLSLAHLGSSPMALLLATSSTIGSWLYVFWYSRFANRQKDKLLVGMKLPVFPLTSLTGETVTSEQFKGNKTLFIFYRGNWCPLCMTQIKEIAASYQALAKDGVRIALISPQPESHSTKLAQKFEVPFEFYVDTDNQAAKALNIFAKNGLPTGLQVFGYDSDTVMPTVLISDEGNRILFSDLTDNYRVRPEPQVFASILNRQNKPRPF